MQREKDTSFRRSNTRKLHPSTLCVKVAEMFDLLSKFTSITAGLKLELSELSKRNLDWDDCVPSELKIDSKTTRNKIEDGRRPWTLKQLK